MRIIYLPRLDILLHWPSIRDFVYLKEKMFAMWMREIFKTSGGNCVLNLTNFKFF